MWKSLQKHKTSEAISQQVFEKLHTQLPSKGLLYQKLFHNKFLKDCIHNYNQSNIISQQHEQEEIIENPLSTDTAILKNITVLIAQPEPQSAVQSNSMNSNTNMV